MLAEEIGWLDLRLSGDRPSLHLAALPCTAAFVAIEALKDWLHTYQFKKEEEGMMTPSSVLLRSKPEDQFQVFSVADLTLKQVQTSVLAMAQLQNQVIAILRHLRRPP
ncbi:hypothetical protein LWI28_020047 [Acer negundo]|uniref:Uncharacterized protein n=1 Tax=Acer negundo TaxID=4023 RepID=A0AAD5NFU3_ACENE|nr:hypothetical protein LWI28_020047 [Acer negundo]